LSKVTIYRFRKYNIGSDGYDVSRRWGTREAIEHVCGEVLEDTAVEVDEAAVATDIEGLTVRGFDPRPRPGFQTQVEVGPPDQLDRPGSQLTVAGVMDPPPPHGGRQGTVLVPPTQGHPSQPASILFPRPS